MRRVWTSIALAMVLVLGGLSAGTRTAVAHASMTASDPPNNAVIAEAPETMVVTFNEPVAPLTMRLVAPGGTGQDLSDIAAYGNSLRVRLPDALGRGTHLLSWRVVSADGHPVGGSVTFSIGEPTVGPAELADLRRQRDAGIRDGAIWLCKLALYLGLMFGCGGAFYAAFISGGPLVAVSRRIVETALGMGLVATFLSVGLQGSDAYDTVLSELRDTDLWLKGLATAYGRTALIALVALLLAAASLNAHRARMRWTTAAALLLMGVALAASGHAGSADPQLLTRPLVLAHVISVGFWIGALPPLCAALRRADSGELARFSRLVPLSIVVLVVSGTGLALIQLRTLDGFWTTTYGWILGGKLALVTVLLTFGAINRFAMTPAVLGGNLDAARSLQRNIVLEIAIAVAILALVAAWRFTPPPRSLQAAAAAPVHAHIHAGKAMADIRVERQSNGLRLLQLTLLDAQFGPLEAKEVVLVLSKPDAGVARVRYPARRSEATIWRIPDLALPVGGRWLARVEILIDDFEKVAIEGEFDLSR
jgi:copper transport protein